MSYCQWECKLVQSLWRTVWRFLKKLILELPVRSTPGHVPGEKSNLRRHTVSTAELFTIVKTWKQMSIDRWMNKENATD